MLVRPFTPGLSIALSLTSTSAATAFGTSTGETVRLYNAAAVPVAFTFGTSAAVAVAPGTTAAVDTCVIAPGVTEVFTREPTTQTHIAAKTLSSTGTLYVSTGEGQ